MACHLGFENSDVGTDSLGPESRSAKSGLVVFFFFLLVSFLFDFSFITRDTETNREKGKKGGKGDRGGKEERRRGGG